MAEREIVRRIQAYASEVQEKLVKLMHESRPGDLLPQFAIVAEAIAMQALIYQFLEGQSEEHQIQYQRMCMLFYEAGCRDQKAEKLKADLQEATRKAGAK